MYEGCGPQDQVVHWFWRFVEGLKADERGLLLRFCTGGSRLPAGGFADLSPRFRLTLVSLDESRTLPTASTCFNLLKLPAYKCEGSLRRQVYTALMMGSEGFSFS